MMSYVMSGAIKGDLIAGLVTGSVLVPQSMSYALLANLPVQYGIHFSRRLRSLGIHPTSQRRPCGDVELTSRHGNNERQVKARCD